MRKAIFISVAIALMTGPIDAFADIFKSKTSRSRISGSHTKLIDSRLSKQYSGSSRLLSTISNRSEIIPKYTGHYESVYKPIAEAAARKFDIPVDLFYRLVQQESNWKPKAISKAGAIGLAQLMPITAKLLGVDPHDPTQNLEGGARYLRQQYNKFSSWRLALAAYNAGPDAVEKYGGVPPYEETLNYVKRILGH